MARIAEDLMLLLLDNASGRPGLDGARRGRVLAAAVLLDLAHACRIRPALPGDPVEAGRLIALAGPASSSRPDPVADAAFAVISREPLQPTAALARAKRGTADRVMHHLEATGQIRSVPLSRHGLRRTHAHPVVDRTRVGQARAEMMSSLFDRRPPAAPTAAIITLLHAADGLGALLSLNDRGWRWVHARAGEIALGSWLHETPGLSTSTAEVNLAVTAAALRPALA